MVPSMIRKCDYGHSETDHAPPKIWSVATIARQGNEGQKKA
jgi:hypothetical protein